MENLKIIIAILIYFIQSEITAQSVGIGTVTPSIGKLEIFGANNGGTVASFGTDGTGISLQRNWPTIAFNQYRDSLNLARYMGNGKASILYYEPSGGSFGWDVYNTAGTANQPITATRVRAMTILSNGNIGVRSNGLSDASLWVERKSNLSGAAVLSGTAHSSYFAWNTQEDTYIRGGKNASKVIINDVIDGKVLTFGRTAIGSYPGNNHVPLVAAEFWGAISAANSYIVNITQGYWITNSALSSYVKVFNTSNNQAQELDIADGVVDGQILIIEGNETSFVIRAPGSVYGNIYGSDINVGGGDVLTLIWNASGVKWMPMSFKNN